jgi:SAM-dependent methyltransferase
MNCKWCNSRIIETEAPSTRTSWKRWACGGCGSIGYREDPSPKELGSIYESAWADPSGCGTFAAGSTSKDIADALIKIGFTEDSNTRDCLDYGSGKGFLAERLALSGCKSVHVLEPFGPDADVPGVEWHRAWEDLPSEVRFDRIFMVEVVEHLLDPVDELRKARSVLSDTGLVLITTPNARGWRARLGKGRWREAQNPTHLNLFSYKALKICLQRAGYIEIHRIKKTMSYNKNGMAGLILRILRLYTPPQLLPIRRALGRKPGLRDGACPAAAARA